ncbi:glycoside hydrolase family 5 protein [Salinarimonas ramus]|uniref:Exo-1,3-beta-glucanase D n=1 Tax=Salinarimonas ramus TaxID=690164 RepID=A0A917Q9E7_9HYPH|nr:cellulase family glycosylhydrolase [Salinarimonas ramus]GGK34033.1 endoglucanase [Salinarimonas ramus]
MSLSRRRLLAGVAAGSVASAMAARPGLAGTDAFAGDDDLAIDVSRLARGVNLPGWLDAGLPETDALATLVRLGITHMRLPVPLERVGPDFADGATAAATILAVRDAVNRLRAAGCVVSVDLHPDTGAFNALHEARREEGLAAAIAAWDALIPFLADLPPAEVALEILNEPVVSAEIWLAQAPRLAAAVRARAPAHTLVYPPHLYQRIEALEETPPLDDPNVVYAVHYYDPMAFTHQGADWNGDGDPLAHLRGLPFPAGPEDARLDGFVDASRRAGRDEAADIVREAYADPWDAERIAADFARAGAWSHRTGRRVIVNEFGVLRWHAHPRDRAAWLAAVRRGAEAAGIGWAHWDYADGFGLAERTQSGDRLDPDTLDALLA